MHREVKKSEEKLSNFRSIYLHANWSDFITLCERLGFGEQVGTRGKLLKFLALSIQFFTKR